MRAFGRLGFYGANLPAIAKEAGISPGLIYRYVTSKDELVNLLFRSLKGTFSAAILPAVRADNEPQAQFTAVMRALFTYAAEQREAFLFLECHHHDSYLDEASKKVDRELRLAFAAWVSGLQRSGSIASTLPPAAIISSVLGAVVFLVRDAAAGHFKLNDGLVTRHIAATWQALTP